MYGHKETYLCMAKLLIFASACIHTPSYVIDVATKLLADFVWNEKKPKIKRGPLIRQKETELNLPEYEI